MKTLANCNPREFMVQTNRIRKSVQNWLSLTRVIEIRKQHGEIDAIPENATDDERKDAEWRQLKKNLSEILNAVMEEHPDETIEMLGLACFIEPDDLENHEMTEIFDGFNSMINCRAAIGFFTSLLKLAKANISISAKQ